VLAFLYIPIVVISLYAFNDSNVQSWPRPRSPSTGSTRRSTTDMQTALKTSLEAATLATTIALVLGSLAAFGVHRFRFFGRESVSFLFVLRSPCRDHHRDGAQLVLHLLGLESRPRDDRRRACDLLRRHRLQQRLARLRRVPDRWPRRRWTSARTASRPSGS